MTGHESLKLTEFQERYTILQKKLNDLQAKDQNN